MTKRVIINIQGIVQGVGFRPFVYKLANSLTLKGWVNNSPSGVIIEAEGEESVLLEFIDKIKKNKPPISTIENLEYEFAEPAGCDNFKIKESTTSGEKTAHILPDLSVCPDCLNDISSPENRRYLYPFTNCTNCGPRYSIIDSLPYDGSNTTMKIFKMCEECESEYHNPDDRRFHAQPNACPVCGPQIELWDAPGNMLLKENEAMKKAASEILNGKIVAVKGLGGFHLLCDARNNAIVSELRARKRRDEKPFAVMFPGIGSIREYCILTEKEENVLNSPQSPILLVRKKENSIELSEYISYNNPYIGVLMPYTPLHHILLSYLKIPVVATSGNISDEPICIHEFEALKRLNGIADYFLVHNRPIKRYVDDSVCMVVENELFVLRRSRGFSPSSMKLKISSDKNILAVGGFLKNSVALLKNDTVFISQYIGDLDNYESYHSFKNTINTLKKIYEAEEDIIVCDMHPDYISAKYAVEQAKEKNIKVVKVQHHISHILSAMTENNLQPPFLGVSWDGTGYGTDNTVWGGEFFSVAGKDIKRIAAFRNFRLPGGEISVKEIFRTALGVLSELKNKIDLEKTLKNLYPGLTPKIKYINLLLNKNINCPQTSSIGRLFDAVASLLDIRQIVNFEGQAAMELEFLTNSILSEEIYNFDIRYSEEKKLQIIDWEKIILEILADLEKNESLNLISVKFHNTLVKIISQIKDMSGMNFVICSGGCFQNKYLLKSLLKLSEKDNIRIYFNKLIPANDGGLALGQITCYLEDFRFSL